MAQTSRSDDELKISALRNWLGEPSQIGLSVRDLSSAIELLSRLFGLVPWERSQWPPPGRHDLRSFHRDSPSDDWRANMATAKLGSIELELVEHAGGESSYGEFFSRVGPGVHHLMFVVDDLPSVLATFGKQGLSISTTIRIGDDDIRWAVVDTYERLGFNIEIKARKGFD